MYIKSTKTETTDCRIGWMFLLRKLDRWHSEQKCANTIDTVLDPWPFPVLKYKYIFQIKYTEATSSNSTWKLLCFEITKMLIAVFKNEFIVHTFVPYYC